MKRLVGIIGLCVMCVMMIGGCALETAIGPEDGVNNDGVTTEKEALVVDSLYITNKTGYMPITCAIRSFKGGAVSGVTMMGPRRLVSADPWNESLVGFVNNGDGTASAVISLPFTFKIDTIAIGLIVDPTREEWWSDSTTPAYYEGKLMIVIDYTNGIVRALSNGEVLYSAGSEITMERIKIDSVLSYNIASTQLSVWVKGLAVPVKFMTNTGGIDTIGGHFNKKQCAHISNSSAQFVFDLPTEFVGQEIYLKMDFNRVDRATMLDPTGSFVWIKLIWFQARGPGRYILA